MSVRSKTASSSARTRIVAAALALIVGVMPTSPALADRALLIGTGDYPHLAADLRLDAPSEDARRLRDSLVRAGFPASRIALMSDREGTAPTRAAVLAALERLASDAVRGEQIMVYFSGHGSQSPAADPRLEPDGLDEIYLMRDAQGWDGSVGRVSGSISDHELSAAIDRIRAKGADVWLVADTCHAGGITRGADGRAKGISASALGIPDRAIRRRAATGRTVPTQAGMGAFAAFYAAGAGGMAMERALPPGSPDARPLSQFTFALTRAIDAGRLRSLRDLAIALNAVDAALGGAAPQPLFEGALSLSVLGLPADRPRAALASRDGDRLTLGAGSEEGFAPGQRFRLVDPAGRATIGQAVAESVALGTSRLRPDAPVRAGAVEAEPILTAIETGPVPPGLLRLAVPITGAGIVRDIQVDAHLWRPGAAAHCARLTADASVDPRTTPIDLLAPPAFGQCDVILATIANGGAQGIDLSPFYVDAAGNVVALSFLDGADVRIAAGERRSLAIRLLDRDEASRPLPIGSERLVLLALPATGRTPADLRGIADARRYRGDAPPPGEAVGADALVYRWTVRPVSVRRRQ